MKKRPDLDSNQQIIGLLVEAHEIAIKENRAAIAAILGTVLGAIHGNQADFLAVSLIPITRKMISMLDGSLELDLGTIPDWEGPSYKQ